MAGPFAAQCNEIVTQRNLLLIDLSELEDRGLGEGNAEYDEVRMKIAAITEDLKVTMGMDFEDVPHALGRRVFTDPAYALSMALAYLACIRPGQVGFLRDPPSTASVAAGRLLLAAHFGSKTRRPRSQRPTITSTNKAVQPGPNPALNLALVARLKKFDADAAKGSEVADRCLRTLLQMRFKGKDAAWSLKNMRIVERLGVASPGPSLYWLALPMVDVVHEEVVRQYLLLTEDERVAFRLTTNQQRFMAAMVTNRDTEQGFLDEVKIYSYVGQVWSTKSKIGNRWQKHFAKSSMNLIVQMLPVARALVNRDDNPIAKEAVKKLRVHPLYVCGPQQINQMAKAVGLSAKFLVTVAEQKLVNICGSMLGDWGTNRVAPVEDMKLYVKLGYAPESATCTRDYSARLQVEITSKCFELDANYDKDSVAGKALRQQVLECPLHDLALGDEFNRVLGSHFGEGDPGMVTVRRMLNMLAAYANSRRKNINKELVKHTVHPLWNKLPIYFDRNGKKYFYDDDVPVGMEMFMIVQLVEPSTPETDPARFEARLQSSPYKPIFFFCHEHYGKTDKKWPDLSAVNFGAKKGKDRAPCLIFSLYKGQDVEKDGKPVRYWTQRNLVHNSRVLPQQMSFIEYLKSPSNEGATSLQRHTHPTSLGSRREVCAPLSQLQTHSCIARMHPSLRRHRLFSLRLAPSMLTL